MAEYYEISCKTLTLQYISDPESITEDALIFFLTNMYLIEKMEAIIPPKFNCRLLQNTITIDKFVLLEIIT